MSDLLFETSPTDLTLVEALCDAAALNGNNKLVLEDRKRVPISYARLKLAMLLLGRRFKAFTEKGERVGVLLPTRTAPPAPSLRSSSMAVSPRC